jgi:hypothetical protein
MPDCIDLETLCGDKYRIGHDPAAATWGERRDPWIKTVRCRLGTIYPFGEQMLAVEVDRHPSAAKRLAAIPGVRPFQDGDQEKTFIFDVSLFDTVVEIVKPRRRRRCHLTEEQKAMFAAAGAARLAGKRKILASRSEISARKRVQEP